MLVGSSEPAELRFNYRTAFNDVWDGASLRSRFGFATVYPDGSAGLVTSL